MFVQLKIQSGWQTIYWSVWCAKHKIKKLKTKIKKEKERKESLYKKLIIDKEDLKKTI